jgi:hypothetical protein
MASDDKTLALWVGAPARATLHSGETLDLDPGNSVCEIGKDEAESSDNWKPLTKKQADAHRAAASNDSGDDA